MITTIIRYMVYLVIILSITGCTPFLFQPDSEHYYSPDVVNVAYEDVYLEVESGISLHGWKLQSRDKLKGTVLFFHGNGVNISTHLASVYWLTAYGYEVYLFDYRGYGKSDGIPDLGDILSDNESIIRYAVEQIPEDKRLTIMGHSMGGSLSIYSAAVTKYKEKIKLLISVDAFSDYQDVTQEVLSKHWLTWLLQYPVSWTINNDYRPLDFIAGVSPIKTLIIHSKQDEIIDFYHAEALYQAASEPKAFEAINGSHNHIFDSQKNRQLILNYLGSTL